MWGGKKLNGSTSQNMICAFFFFIMAKWFLSFLFMHHLKVVFCKDLCSSLFKPEPLFPKSRVKLVVINTITLCSESTPALSNSSQMDMYDQRASQTRRYPPSVSSSPQKDMQSKVRPKLTPFLLDKRLNTALFSIVLRGVAIKLCSGTGLNLAFS